MKISDYSAYRQVLEIISEHTDKSDLDHQQIRQYLVQAKEVKDDASIDEHLGLLVLK